MFNHRKTILSAAVATAMGGVSFSASAALTSTATLDFTQGSAATTGCLLGTTPPPCTNPLFNVTDIVGSYFTMDNNGNGSIEIGEKNPIGSLNGIVIGSTQNATGSHPGSINGTEVPNIDNPWTFFGGTGMHKTTGNTTVASEVGNTAVLSMPWAVTWNGIATIPMGQQSAPTLTCDTSTCSDSSNYTLDAAYHVGGAGFTTVGYTLHLEGHITQATSEIPVPAAAWLFGSGLMGLAGVARRRKSIK